MKDIKIGNRTIEIRPEWKTGFFAAWIVGMLAHAYRFFNFLPSWDSMYNFTGTGATYMSGRVFLDFFSKISSKYDMSWVNGALSLLYISIAVVLLIDLFQIKGRLSCILTAALVVSFPTVTSTFAYMFTADSYMLAFLLAAAGVWLTFRFKHGIWPGMVCICLSMGTYQAYIAVALVLVLMVVIRDLLLEKKSMKAVFFSDYKYLLLVIGGAILYKITSSIINAALGVTLNGYQGIDSMGLMSLAEYKEAFRKTASNLAHLFELQNGFVKHPYTLANLAVLGGILIGTIILIIKNKTYKDVLGAVVSVLAVVFMPIAAFAVNFVSPHVSYHTLMEMGVCFLYLLLLLYIEHGNWAKRAGKALKALGIAVLVFLAYYNTVNANIAYFNMNLSYEKSYAVSGDILSRMQDLDEYDEITRVAVIGDYHAYSGGIDELKPAIMGVSNDLFLNGGWHYISFWNNCYGILFAQANGNEEGAIRETEEFQDMPVYPYKGCVSVINDTIVVKLSE